MGLVRLLLAVCVFCEHSRPLGNLPWTSGDLAVELFFVISGFYMQLILSAKYTKQRLGKTWISQFYKARYFRLLPLYLAGCILVLVATFLDPEDLAPLSIWRAVAALPHSFANDLFKIFLGFTNLTLIFQNAIRFLAVHHNQVQWAVNFRNTDIDLWRGLAIPPAWSLGAELMFYLLAPFLLNLRSRWLVVSVAASLAAKLTAIVALDLDWSSGIFPFELGYFLLGALAFRYTSALTEAESGNFPTLPLYAFAVGLVIFSVPSRFAPFFYPAILTCLLPSLFKATSHGKIDHYLGELSYPFYIFHVFAIQLGITAARYFPFWPSDIAAWLGLAFTFALAAVAVPLELRFIEPWRTRFAQPLAAGVAAVSEETRVPVTAATRNHGAPAHA